MNVKGKKVFVGLSGGVDSSVAALLLKKEGYQVYGVFITVWQPPFLECTAKEDRQDAMRVCANLNIPFIDCNAEEIYKKYVVEYMIEEYKKGRTPNPDVMCNKYVKFGVFFDFAMANGADFIVTGHYARVGIPEVTSYKLQVTNNSIPQTSLGKYKLLKAKDHEKEQSYFLWTLKQEQLSKTFFPIGKYQKKEVREIARKNKLFTGDKKDSQGLCFLGKLDMKEFLKHYIHEKPGNVLDKKGSVIGSHMGAVFFTYGERHGFTLTAKTSEDKPLYVISKDIMRNTITVDEEIINSADSTNSVILENINIINLLKWQAGITLGAQYRYHGKEHKVMLEKDGSIWKVKFKEPIADLALGQSIVFYDGNECIGGGILDKKES